MGRAFTINLGINDLKRQLANIDKYDQDTQNKMRNSVQISTEKIYVGAKKRVRVRSGNLIKKIVRSYDPIKNVGKVEVKSPVAHLVERGAKGVIEIHRKKKALHGGKLVGFASKVNIPPRKAHPFFEPAVLEEKPNFIKNMEDAIKP